MYSKLSFPAVAAIFAAALLSLVAAQSAITSTLFIPEANGQEPIVASVITAKDSTTTYAIGCPSSLPASDCDFSSTWSMTYGPGFYEAQTTQSGAYTWSDRCEIFNPTSILCTVSVNGSEALTAFSSTTTLALTDIISVPVTITAGLEKLSGSASARQTSSSGSSSAAASSSTITATTAPATTGSVSSSGSSTSSAKPKSTNGAAMIGMEMEISLIAVVGAALPAFLL